MERYAEQDKDDLLAHIDRDICYHKTQLERLIKTREAYLSAGVKPSDSPPLHPYLMQPPARHIGITTRGVDEVIESIFPGEAFTASQVFQKLYEKNDLRQLKRRNALAHICSILSARIKQGKLVKGERGCYIKPKEEIMVGDQSLLQD